MFSRVNMIKIERVSNRGTLAGLYIEYTLGYPNSFITANTGRNDSDRNYAVRWYFSW